MGRSIRRLVSLFDTLGALVAENDRRSIAEEDGSDDESTNESSRLAFILPSRFLTLQ